MLGAIAGDVIGSIYEHSNIKTKDFPLFNAFSRYTDDSVMTLAVAEALLRSYPLEDPFDAAFETAECMHRWGTMFPDAGYGGMFRHWLWSNDPQPYNSLGNGSAMRVSAVGWIYRDNLEKARAVAKATAMPTHNHPEGVKGAEAVTSAIWLALNGKNKAQIKEYIQNEFSYNLERSLDEIRPEYTMDATCPGSVPEAIIAFLEGSGFEDVIRGAISIGGDSDTIAAIAGGIAEAFYGIPANITKEVRNRLTVEQNRVVDAFEIFRKGQKAEAVVQIRKVADWNLLGMNHNIEINLDIFRNSPTENNLQNVLGALHYNLDWGKFFVIGRFEEEEGREWIATATSARYIHEEYLQTGEFIPMKMLFSDVLSHDASEGIVINPWTQGFHLTKDLIRGLCRKR